MLIAKGEILRSICCLPGFPSKSTVTRWLMKNDEFWDLYARAREQQAYALIDEVIYLAHYADCDSAAALRLKIDSIKWAASKLNPKRYGKHRMRCDPSAHELEGEETETDDLALLNEAYIRFERRSR